MRVTDPPNDWKQFHEYNPYRCDGVQPPRNPQAEMYALAAAQLYPPLSVQLDMAAMLRDKQKDEHIAMLESMCAHHENEIAVLHRALRMAKARIPPQPAPPATVGDRLAAALRFDPLPGAYGRVS
jgi:hypothetical protein